MGSVSYWTAPKPVRRARSVAVAELARATRALLDEGGIPAVTMRGVAQRLGVAAASLYSRISSVDDLFDIALDDALGDDEDVWIAAGEDDLRALMLAYYRHLVVHPWACRVIAMRAPRGPHYLALSDRMCALLEQRGARDPLGEAYRLSNFVIGSAVTTPMAQHETLAAVDGSTAPTYAALHATQSLDPMELVTDGLRVLIDGVRHR